MKVNEMIEKPSMEEVPSQIVVLSRYIITLDVFNYYVKDIKCYLIFFSFLV